MNSTFRNTICVLIPLLAGAEISYADSPYDALIKSNAPTVHLNFNEPTGPTASDTTDNANSAGYGSNVTFGVASASVAMTSAVTNKSSDPIKDTEGNIISNAYLAKIAGSSSLQFGNRDFTIELWFNPDTIDNTRMDLLSYEIGDDLGIILNQDGGSGAIEYYDTVSGHTAAGVVTPNTWHLLDVVRSGGQVRLYLDGKNVKFTTDDGTVADTKSINYDPSNPGFIAIGSGKDFTKDYYNPNVFKGSMDEFALYNSALTPEIIGSHYSAGLNQNK